MKSEADVTKQIDDARTQLEVATGEGRDYIQGYIAALRWITVDEESTDDKGGEEQ